MSEAEIVSSQEQDDTMSVVLANYKEWKGEPVHIFRTSAQSEQLSNYFSILQYHGDRAYSAYCTAGSSHNILPHSIEIFGDVRGVRFEYIMHSDEQFAEIVCETLHMVALYPFITHTLYSPGFVLPIGKGDSIVEGSDMRHLYFTYPYVDDPRIFDPPCWGELNFPTFLVQTLWVFPIHQSEMLFIQSHGPDAFEQLCNDHKAQLHDFFRPPVV